MSDLIDRAEVMKLLDEQCWNGMFTYFRGEHHVNCFRELVKAIPSIENKGDLISRQAVIDSLKEHRVLYCDNTPETFSKLSYAEKSRVDELDTAIATIINLPSAEDKKEWIPVSERLPVEREWYLAVFKEKDTNFHLIPRVADYIGCGENKWRLIDEDGIPQEYLDLLECIAWMPLPEPYKKGEANGK